MEKDTTMNELYILRHAPAVPRGSPEYPLDADRPLTREGIAKMELIAQALAAFDLGLEFILSSPYVRAKQTAQIAADALGLRKQLGFSEHLASEGPPQKLIEELQRDHRTRASVMLVGHEPYLSEFVALLMSGDPQTGLRLKKGGVCKLSLTELRFGRCATLEWLLTPKQLTGLAGR